MDNLDYIESYFSNGPDAARAREFQERIETDPAFAEEVAFYLSALAVSRENAITKKKLRFREIYQENPAAGSRPDIQAASPSPQDEKIRSLPVRKWVTYMAVAAVAAGIIFGLYTFSQRESPRQLAEKYEKEQLQTLGVKMSSGSDSIQTGLRLYNEGKTAEALVHFERIIQSDTSNFTAREYAGLAALRQKEYEKALTYFEQLEIYSGLYANPALLFQALTLMERNQSGDLAKAKIILTKIVAKDLEGKELAQEWLKKM
jgi:tetratricopeptide (TPR) repeat protein